VRFLAALHLPIDRKSDLSLNDWPFVRMTDLRLLHRLNLARNLASSNRLFYRTARLWRG
jgi:hypothetical protein